MQATLAIPLAYLLGAIPFGYLTARWFRGIDIRTVGSGNIGATNVGRVLGFRFFLFVFTLDLLKGFLPTYFLPKLVAELSGKAVPELGVFVALATIMGHNFPVYLKFRGGKGVATSLGALLALDWVASLAAALGFILSLVATGFVSLSSIIGGLVFVTAYFGRVKQPWSQEHLAMSVVTIGLCALLIVRHRKNLARIRQGTEPRVSFRKKDRSGRIAWFLIPALALMGAGAAYWLSVQANRTSEVRFNPFHLVEVDRVGTGLQRAERVAYADGGKRLAVTCPRYNEVIIYSVTPDMKLEVASNIELEGKPVAVQAVGNLLYVLQRPPGDERHVKPGWWETFDLEGNRKGARVEAGMYPDDLAITPDGRLALILTSGRGEGDPDRPAPALEVRDLHAANPAQAIGRIEFNQPGDDPARLSLSRQGKHVAVTLLGSDQVAAVDLTHPEQPSLLGRQPFGKEDIPHLSVSGEDAILSALAPGRDGILIPWPKAFSLPGACIACIVPHSHMLTLLDSGTRRLLGELPLRAGSFNLGLARPMGLAYSHERGLIAIATRSGSVHLISVTSNANPTPPTSRQLSLTGN